MSKNFTVGSLFTGIGGIDLGLERTGRFTIAWQVEIDDYCQKILAKQWPNVARFRDVRTCGKNTLAPVDVLCGGFPCQDISSAGKRAGITGEKSGLWKEYLRIIRTLRPRYVVIENVSALVNRGLCTILGDLAESGYDAEWQIISAASVGALHKRERVIILAYPHGNEPSVTTQDRSNSTPSTERSSEWVCRDVAYPNCDRSQAGEQKPELLQEQEKTRVQQSGIRYSSILTGPITQWDIWADEPTVGRVADGISHRVDRLRGLGNAVVPQVAEYIGQCIASWHDKQNASW